MWNNLKWPNSNPAQESDQGSGPENLKLDSFKILFIFWNLKWPLLRIIKLTIKLCVFLVHILSGHYICLQVNYSFSAFVSDWFPISHNSNIDLLKFSVKNSVEIMDTILTLTRTLVEVRYRQRVLNTKVGCVFPFYLASESLSGIEMSQNSAFRSWMLHPGCI